MEKRLLVVLCLLCFVGIPKTLYGFSQVSTAFVENRGQISHHLGDSTPKVLFYANLGNATVFLHPSALSVVTKHGQLLHRGTIRFSNSNPSSVPQGELRSDSVTFHLNGNSAQSVCSFETIRYSKVLPSYDLLCSISKGFLTLKWILNSESQGSQPANLNIQQLFEGFQIQGLHSNSMQLRTELGSAIATYSLQSSGSTELVSQLHGATTAQLTILAAVPQTMRNPQGTPHETLGITATINLSSYMGGSGQDSTSSGTNSGSGMILCGGTASTNFPTTVGTQQTSLQGPRDAFICSLDAQGKRKWSTYFGANGDDIAIACCKANAKIYVVGRTTSTSGLASPNCFQSTYGGGSSDAFVASFDENTGKLLNCTYYGGTDADEARAVCTLASGDVVIAGTSLSTDLAMNGQQTTNPGGSDAIAIRLDESLKTKKWSTYYGGRSSEEGRGIAALSDGSVALCGNTSSPNSGAFIAANVGEGSTPPGGLQASGFLVRLDANGKRIWGRYVGGDHYDTLTCIVVDKDFIFLGGYSNSSAGSTNNFISANSAQQSFNGGESDAFVCKLSSDGNRIWGSYAGGSGNDRCLALSLSSNQDVISCGTTSSTDFPLALSDQQNLSGSSDAFVNFFLKDGSKYVVSMLVGGNGEDFANAITVQNDGSVIVAGSTTSTDIKTVDEQHSVYSGAMDAFIMHFDALYVVNVKEFEDNTSPLICFPNPCNAQLSLVLPENSPALEQCSIRIENALGSTVSRIELPQGLHNPIETASLPAGTYSISIISGSIKYRTRFVKLSN